MQDIFAGWASPACGAGVTKLKGLGRSREERPKGVPCASADILSNPCTRNLFIFKSQRGSSSCLLRYAESTSSFLGGSGPEFVKEPLRRKAPPGEPFSMFCRAVGAVAGPRGLPLAWRKDSVPRGVLNSSPSKEGRGGFPKQGSHFPDGLRVPGDS